VFLFFYFLFLSDQIQRLNFYVLITKEKNTYAVLIKIFFFMRQISFKNKYLT